MYFLRLLPVTAVSCSIAPSWWQCWEAGACVLERLDTKDPALRLRWTKPLKATPAVTTGLSQRVFPCLAHQRSASHQRTLASTLLVLFLGDYLSCVCLCVCLYMCVLRANAMQVDIKKNRVNRSSCSCHWRQWSNFFPFSPSASCFSCLLFFHSVSLNPLLPSLLGVPYVCSGLGSSYLEAMHKSRMEGRCCGQPKKWVIVIIINFLKSWLKWPPWKHSQNPPLSRSCLWTILKGECQLAIFIPRFYFNQTLRQLGQHPYQTCRKGVRHVTTFISRL